MLSINDISALFLVVACVPVVYFDIRYNRVPNWIPGSGIIGGVFLLVFFRRPEFVSYASAFLLGFGLFYVFFCFGWVGGADVKLMAMVGILMGLDFFISAFIAISVAGGIISTGYIIIRLLKGLKVTGIRIPYGTAISIGVYYTVFQTFGINP